MKKILTRSLPHIIAIILFIVVSYVYFLPQLQNKVLNQSDVIHYKGMAKEIIDYREINNNEPLWTSHAFSGMPSFLISTQYPANKLIILKSLLFIGKRPASYMFVALIGFYIALLIFGASSWLSIAGALAFGLSTFFMMFYDAGHNTKIQAIALMPVVIASVYMVYRKNLILGISIFGLFLGLQLYVNHPQMVYYTAIAILIYGIYEFIEALKSKTIIRFIKTTLILFIPVLLAIGCNLTRLWNIYEYTPFTMRGKSELVLDDKNQTSGLDIDYATQWSYGIDETFTLLIPNFKGGSSQGELSTNSETYKLLRQNNVPDSRKIIKALPLYHGSQPFTSGTIYFGAIVMFLFIMGTILIKGPIKWWLITIVIVSVVFSWGKNFMAFTELLMNYLPGYNKFRDMKMIMVIAMFATPLLGFLSLKQILNNEIKKEEIFRALKYAFYIAGGLTLFFALFPGVLDYSSNSDTQLPEWIIEAIKADRKNMLRNDAFRSFVFISIAAVVIWLFLKEKIKKNQFIIILGALILIDLWVVDKRFVDKDNFETARKMKNPYPKTKADEFILQDSDPNFRVLNLTVSTFQDASTSYYHKSLGGYHGAKMQRYQELIDFHLQKEMQQLINILNKKSSFNELMNAFKELDVLNMLNTKYVIYNKNAPPLNNAHALGNAWFIDSIVLAENANEEIEQLYNINTAKTAVLDKKFKNEITGLSFLNNDSASIKLDSFAPNKIVYQSNSSTKQLAVFSEVYYPKGWNAYIDGELHNHFRANYILRAIIVPSGKHTIEFKFEPKSYYLGEKVSFASSLLLIIFFLGVLFMEIKKEINILKSDAR